MAAAVVARARAAPSIQTVGAIVALNVVILAASLRGLAVVLLGLAIVVPLGLLIVQRPQRGVIAVVALVPFDGLLDIVPHPFIVEGWKEALIFSTVVATLLAPASARGPEGRRLPAWTSTLLGLVAVGAVSAVGVGGLSGAYGLKVYFYAALVAVAAWRCPLDGRERDRVVSVLMFGGIVTAIYGLVQQLLGPTRLHDLGYEYNTTIRTSGSFLRSFSTFADPFGFAYYLMIVVLLCLPVALADRMRTRNQLFILATPLLAAGLVSAIVRGAWLGVAVGLVYLGIRRYRILLLAIVVGLVALLFLPADASNSALGSQSSQERVATWSEGVSVITSHPLGVGIGLTGSTAAKVGEFQDKTTQFVVPDNYYFFIAYELGPIGLWLHVLLIVGILIAARAASATLDGADGAFADGLTAFVVAAASASVMATFFQIFPSDVLWWAAVGIVATTVSLPRRDAMRAGDVDVAGAIAR
jgi:hypothetical protein